MKRLRVVCAVIEDAKSQVLLCKRSAVKAQAGLWEFPGGKVEFPESDQQALEREIREELACRVRVLEQLSPVEHDYPELSLILVPYRCALLDGEEPVAIEHEEIRWVTLEEAGWCSLSAADQPILRGLQESQRIR